MFFGMNKRAEVRTTFEKQLLLRKRIFEQFLLPFINRHQNDHNTIVLARDQITKN